MARDQIGIGASIYDPETGDASHTCSTVSDGHGIVWRAHFARRRSVVNQVHVVLQPVEDFRVGLHAWTGFVLGNEDGGVSGNLADALEGGNGHLLVSWVGQPVRIDDGPIKGIVALNGHVADRFC